MSVVRGTLAIAGCVALLAASSRPTAAQRPALRTPARGEPVDGPAAPSIPYPVPPSTVEAVLEDMASRASVIFVGSVTAVRRVGGNDLQGNVSAGIVEIDFALEQPVRGPAAGTVYTLREWAGLWRDAPRFAVGQRRLMLLHAANAGGLSSPVDGIDGAIPIAPAAPISSAPADPHQPVTIVTLEARADLRWLAAKQLRPIHPVQQQPPLQGEPGDAAPRQMPQSGEQGAQPECILPLSHLLRLLEATRASR